MNDAVPALVDHLFRHRAGQMISSLARIFGAAHMDLAEDVVQDALLQALRVWPFHGIPDDPTAWLFRVARNRALDAVRRDASLHAKEPAIARWLSHGRASVAPGNELGDGELGLLFACCHPTIPVDAGIALALRTVAGFSTAEIARAFLLDEATVAQRLVRAKRRLRDAKVPLDVPDDAGDLAARRHAVLAAIYLMFNEGYAAGEGDALVRHDLCGEALRLALLMPGNPATHAPEVDALIALFCFQMARLPTRTTEGGDVILLIDQDRARWDRGLIEAGLRHLHRAAAGTTLTSYHLQAQIASCHAVASSYTDTNWRAILDAYDLLVTVDPSPVVLVNRAIAMSMVHGPATALAELERAAEHPGVARYVWFHAARAYLSAESGQTSRAREHYTRALALTFSAPARRHLAGRLGALVGDT